MSDASQGPGWWLASDGKWYSPDQVPGYDTPTGPAPSDAGGCPPSGPPGGCPPSGSPGYGPPSYPPSFGPTGYAPPGTGVPYGFAGPRTNGLAIAAMVCSFFFWVYGIGAILGIVFGFIARSQIERSGGMQQGKGMALAGIIIGFAGIAIGIILVIVLVVALHHCDQNGGCPTTTFNTGG